MHPIEHLRYVARAQGADPTSLVEETAHALGSLRFDPSGLVVGIITAIYSPSGGSVGIAFSIPASTVKNVIAQLMH